MDSKVLDINNFKRMAQHDAEAALDQELGKLLLTSPIEGRSLFANQFRGFKDLFSRHLKLESDRLDWNKINILEDDKFLKFEEMSTPEFDERKKYLDQLVVIKLNGGLGTTMGCVGPKALISVRNDLTFLDLAIRQIERLNEKYSTDIPLVLMNSFNTEEETEKVLRKYQQMNVRIFTFQQSRFPRLSRESLLPTATKIFPWHEEEEAWYPPGHGDIYRSFLNSGYLDKFLQEGRKWIFVSNIDNMGASVHTGILKSLEDSGAEFAMEVTEKTRADVKGGTLVEYNGNLRLLEIAQVPKEYVDDFTSVRKFKIFNTNNIWVKSDAIKRAVTENTLQMEVIVNPKTLDSGLNVIQLEEAIGAAIQSFKGAVGVKVPRSRFLPVKTTSDLLMMMSNLYTLDGGRLVVSPLRSFPSIPLVKLGSQFKRVKDFLSRFESIPDLLQLDHLTLSGDVTFGKDVVLKGTVIIIANHGDRIDIPRGAVLDNKIVSGNIRILDH